MPAVDVFRWYEKAEVLIERKAISVLGTRPRNTLA